MRRATIQPPDPSNHAPDPDYLRRVIESKGYTHSGAARAIGASQRAMRYWLSGGRRFPYVVQYAIESLPAIPA